MPETTIPTKTEPNVLMRFLTQGGAVVEVTKGWRRGRLVYPYLCLGCDYEFDNYSGIWDARHEANAHAEKCRAMPKPEAWRRPGSASRPACSSQSASSA